MPLQAVCTTLATTVGMGNIVGVAGAIAIGGPGAVFWMWISTLLGMCTKFSEVTMKVYFRERNKNNDYMGGPMYYIRNGLGKSFMWLTVIYSVLGVLTVFGTGNAMQVNTITAALDSAFLNYGLITEKKLSLVNLIIGIFITMLVLMDRRCEKNRTGDERFVPFMAVLYVILALGILIIHADRVPSVFSAIFTCAFSSSAYTGEMVGSMFVALKKGVSRGIFPMKLVLGQGTKHM